MKNSKRAKQDAIILMAIVVVILLLWRLYISRKPVGVGAWATTNIFGPTTMSLLSGNGPDTANRPPPPPNPTEPVVPISTNIPPPARPPNHLSAHAAPPALSTNLVNTNGPVTLVNIPAADLVATPPGVTYASNVSEASTIEQRLGEASAKGGDIQISLFWNNYNDLDLHCIDPNNEEIWYMHTRAQRSPGELDVDRNAFPPYTPTPVENIYWPIGKAPAGLYKIYVVFFSPRNGLNPAIPTPFTVRTVVRDWQTFYFRSTITFTPGLPPKLICTLQYDPQNPDPAQRYRFVR